MKQYLLIVFYLSLTLCSLKAQNVNGILVDATNSVTRDASAAFEINANTNTPGSPLYGGLLIPRIALTGTTDVTTISGTETISLLVYNTTAVSDVTPGYYYWNGSSWQRIIGSISNVPSGSGTQNYVTKWNNVAGTTLGNSQIVDDATNVGVGMGTGAISKLHTSGTLTVGAGTTAETVGNVQITTGGPSPISNRLIYGTDGSGWKFAIGKNQGGTVTEQLTLMDNGNVGIGTNTPGAKLSVTGGINWNGNGTSEFSQLGIDQGGNIELGGTNSLANPVTNGVPYIDFHFGTGAAQDNNVRIINSANNRLDFSTASDGNVLTVNSANVGIGVIGPLSKLHISGDFLNQNLEGYNTTTAAYNLAYNATNTAINLNGGSNPYVQVYKVDGNGVNGSAILITSHVNVSGSNVKFNNPAGAASAQLSTGQASFRITLQRATDAAFTQNLTSLVSGEKLVSIQIENYYMKVNGINNQADIMPGNRYTFSETVNLNYFDDVAASPSNYYYYRLLFNPVYTANINTTSTYSVNDRSLSVMQLKR